MSQSIRLGPNGLGDTTVKRDTVQSAVHAIDPATAPVLSGLEQAHTELWRKFIDSCGIIHDDIGDLPGANEHLLTLMRYIARNPLRANLVKH